MLTASPLITKARFRFVVMSQLRRNIPHGHCWNFLGLNFSPSDRTGCMSEVVTFDDERVISVIASTNDFKFKSLKEFAGHVLGDSGKGKSGFEIKVWQSSRVDGEPATRMRVEYDDHDSRVVEEKLLALRQENLGCPEGQACALARSRLANSSPATAAWIAGSRSRSTRDL